MSLFRNEQKTTLTPRKYQLNAFEAVKVYLEYREGNPCVVLPTGAGKTIVLALICQWVCSWGGRVLLLAHVKELLQQAADKLNEIAPELHVGVYSAGLERKERDGQVTVAGIQSIYNKAGQFDPWDLVIVDECHLLPPDGEGMYRSFLTDARKRNTNLRLVGLTATPFRTSTGRLCGEDQLLRSVCYEVGVVDLIRDGFLCPLKSKHVMDCDTSGLHVRAGEFVADEVNLLMSAFGIVEAAVKQIIERTADRKSVLIFCASVEHAEKVSGLIEGSELVTGETASRETILSRFKNGETKFLVNVNVLTTGFDAPNVDCVVLLRPTMSPGLYYQMVGRGFRLSSGKDDCLVLDFGGNIKRHGPINQIRPSAGKKGSSSSEAPTKKCPDCDEVVYLQSRTCPSCGFEWSVESLPFMASHDGRYGTENILDEENGEEEHSVMSVRYSVHTKRGVPIGDPDHPPTMRVDYQISLAQVVSEWVCIEHGGFAGNKAKLWWSKRSADKFPASTTRAVDIAEGGGLATPLKVRFRPDGKYTKITGVTLGPVPAGVEAEESDFDFADVTPEQDESFDFGELPF